MVRVLCLFLLPSSFLLAGTTRADEPLELVQTIVLKGRAGKLDHVNVDAKRGRLLLANKVNNTVDVVDLAAGKLMKQIPNQQGAQGIAIAPALDRLVFALGVGGLVNILEA